MYTVLYEFMNKIQLMKKLQQIKGYSQHDNAHTVPISSIKQLEEKHAKPESLIQKCMKSLIKQRLSGRLINMERKKRQSQQIQKPSNKLSQPNLLGLNGYLNSSIKNTRYQNPELTPLLDLSYGHTRHQSTVATVMDRSIPQSTKNRSSLANEVQSILRRRKRQQSTVLDLRKNVDVSFISAIDHHEDENSPNKNQLYQNSIDTANQKQKQLLLRLPKIRIKNSIAAPSTTSLPKILIKKSPGYNVNQDFWKILTNQFEMKQRSRKLSNSSAQILNIQSSSANIAKQIKSSLFKPTVPSSSRQNFQVYINNLIPPFVRLLQFVFSFFQIKIPSQLPIMYYSEALEQLKTVHERGWSFVAFIFWDIGKDGIITSRDIFDIFRQWNSFTEKTVDKNQGKTSQIQQYDQKSKINKPKDPSKHKRVRKQSLNNLQNIQNALRQYRLKEDLSTTLQRNQTMSSKPQQEVTNIKMYMQSLQQIKKSLSLFNKQINRINDLVSSTSYEQVNIQQLKQPQQAIVSYLQQVVLSDPNIKYRQVVPLFSAGGNISTQIQHTNQPKLQIFKTNLGIKCSSSYRQCFISTQHNQQTRMSRQKIDNYKLQLKKMRHKKNLVLQQKGKQNVKIIKQLNYVKVAESQMGRVIKQIVFNLLGFQQ